MSDGAKKLSWYGPGSRTPFCGYSLPGMVYVAEASGIPCVLDARLPISRRMPIPRHTQAHPAYESLSPEHRHMLLQWHEGGRTDATMPTGIVMMHLHSLERRLLCGNPSAGEAALLRAEIKRMMRLMADDPVFRRAAGFLLEEADRRAVMAGEVPILLLGSFRACMTAGLRLHIARMMSRGRTLGFAEAMAGWLSLGGREGRHVADVGVLVRACEKIWPRAFPIGLTLLHHGIPRLPRHAYSPSMWSLKPHPLEHEPNLPDPHHMDWVHMEAFVAAVARSIGFAIPPAHVANAQRGEEPIGTQAQATSKRHQRATNPLRMTDEGEQMAAGANGWLATHKDYASMPREELVSRILGSNTAPTKRNLSRTAVLLHARGWGMEPDALWSDALAARESPAFIFRLDSSEPRADEVSLSWVLTILLWSSTSEDAHGLRRVCDATGCGLDMRRRLRLCSQWWETGPKPRRARLRWACRFLAATGMADKGFEVLLGFLKGGATMPSGDDMSILEDASKVMGLGSPWTRIMGLEKPPAVRGRKRPSDLVMVAGTQTTGDLAIPPRPVEIPEPISSSGSSSASGFDATIPDFQAPVLDPDVLSRVVSDTREAASLLSSFWEEEIVEPAEKTLDGLSPALLGLLQALLEKDCWDEQEFAELAVIAGMRALGASEAVNEWSWERLDGAILEETDGGWTIDPDMRAAALDRLAASR